MIARYAVFYAPPADAPLWEFGSSVIGYDAQSGATPSFPDDLPCPAAEWRALTEEARRYGFHATLKPPFHLAEGASEDDLLQAAHTFASARRPFDCPPLQVSLVGAFVAFVAPGPSPALDDLAAESVRAFEPFRAPLGATDLARRLAAPLSERQVRHLDRWGYPYVFEDFRFHMTLTGRLPAELREPVRARLEKLGRGLANALRVEEVAIFRQSDRESPFRVLSRLPFGVSLSRAGR